MLDVFSEMDDEQRLLVLKTKLLARVAAQIVDTQLFGTDLACRHEARGIPRGKFNLRETVPTKMGALKALRTIEGTNDGST